MESYALLNKGEQLDLSEEMFAFCRTANDLYNLTLDYDGNDINLEYILMREVDVLNLAFNISKDMGVIPESAWSVKFNKTTGFDYAQTLDHIRRRFSTFVKGKRKGSAGFEQIVTEVMVGPGAFPSAPPSNFVHKGRRYTGKEFLRDLIGFDPNHFRRFDLTGVSPKQLDLAILRIKHALARGLTVPIRILVFQDVPGFEMAKV